MRKCRGRMRAERRDGKKLNTAAKRELVAVLQTAPLWTNKKDGLNKGKKLFRILLNAVEDSH